MQLTSVLICMYFWNMGFQLHAATPAPSCGPVKINADGSAPVSGIDIDAVVYANEAPYLDIVVPLPAYGVFQTKQKYPNNKQKELQLVLSLQWITLANFYITCP